MTHKLYILFAFVFIIASVQAQSQSTSNCLNNPGTPNPHPATSGANGGYISLGELGQESQFSVSMWVNPTSAPNGHSILLDCSHGGSSNWVIQSLDYGVTWGWLGINFTLAFDTWQHLLCTYNNGVARVFVDGTLIGQNNHTITWGATNLYLGNWPEGGRRFKGKVDELLITRNLLYDAQFVPKEITNDSDVPANSLGIWHFDEGTGTVTENATTDATTDINSWTWSTRPLTTGAEVSESLPSWVSADGLIGWWGFNGHANDISGNDNNAGGSATLTTDRRGNANRAYYWDGVDDYLQAPGSASIDEIETLDRFSLSMWFKNQNADVNAAFGLINKYRVSNDRGWELLSAQDFIEFIVGTTNTIGYVPGNTCIPDMDAGQWLHFAFSYSKADQTAKVYVNGSEVCNKVINIDITTSESGPLYFGYSPSGPDEFSKGRYDEIGLWNRVLTASEVAGLYESIEISTHPSGSSVAGGQQTSMNVVAAVADGVSLSYQWQRNDGSGFANISDGADYSGSTSATLTIKSAKRSKAGPYRCVVSTTNASVNSNGASLTVTCPCNTP